MKPILLVSAGCSMSEEARRLLEEHGYKYREVEAMTPEGVGIALKYNAGSLPSIIDEENKIAFCVSDFYRYLDMVNKEY